MNMAFALRALSEPRRGVYPPLGCDYPILPRNPPQEPAQKKSVPHKGLRGVTPVTHPYDPYGIRVCALSVKFGHHTPYVLGEKAPWETLAV